MSLQENKKETEYKNILSLNNTNNSQKQQSFEALKITAFDIWAEGLEVTENRTDNILQPASNTSSLTQKSIDSHLITLFLKKVIDEDQHNPETLINFRKILDTILQSGLHVLLPRAFANFLNALVILLNYETTYNRELEIARCIFDSWDSFQYYFLCHIKMYARSPNDLLTILSLSVFLRRYPRNTDYQKDVPVDDIVCLYKNIKGKCNPDLQEECMRYFKKLNINFITSKWTHFHEELFSVPTTESIISEASIEFKYGAYTLQRYEEENNVCVCIRVERSWSNNDISDCISVNLILLHQEFCHPIQSVFRQIIFEETSSYSSTLFSIMTGYADPIGITFSVLSFNPAIVFQLSPTVQGNHFTKGSLVFLVPTTDDLNSIPKTAMMGYIVHYNSSYNSVYIHIISEDLHRLQFSLDTYYIIIHIHMNSASTLSVIQWLYKQHINCGQELLLSSVLTSRILSANNNISFNSQSKLCHGIHNTVIPSYLNDVEIDISCIMGTNSKGEFKAKPGENIWPERVNRIITDHWSSLYTLLPTQLDAVQFAMNHHVAVISGHSGTGKTFIAGKLAQLMTEALIVGQIHQPVLIVSKLESTLDNILSSIVDSIPTIVRFGSQSSYSILTNKQATHLSIPYLNDPNHHEIQDLQRRLVDSHIKLKALITARFQAFNHDPEFLCATIPQIYLEHLQKGYLNPNDCNYLDMWLVWSAMDVKTTEYPVSLEKLEDMKQDQKSLEDEYMNNVGYGLLQIIDPSWIKSKLEQIAHDESKVALPIEDNRQWPFESSICSGVDLSALLLHVWERFTVPEDIWKMKRKKRSKLIVSISNTLVQCLENEIQGILQDQANIGESLEEKLFEIFADICRANRIIGMTSDFASKYCNWVSSGLQPRSIIVDEAPEILESTLASIILGPQTEHIVLLGDKDSNSKPKIVNHKLSGNPRNLDVSLFERWIKSGGEFVSL